MKTNRPAFTTCLRRACAAAVVFMVGPAWPRRHRLRRINRTTDRQHAREPQRPDAWPTAAWTASSSGWSVMIARGWWFARVHGMFARKRCQPGGCNLKSPDGICSTAGRANIDLRISRAGMRRLTTFRRALAWSAPCAGRGPRPPGNSESAGLSARIWCRPDRENCAI